MNINHILPLLIQKGTHYFLLKKRINPVKKKKKYLS